MVSSTSPARHESFQRSLQHLLVPFEALYSPTCHPCRCLHARSAHQRDGRTAPQAVVDEESGSTAIAEAGGEVLWDATCSGDMGELSVLRRETTTADPPSPRPSKRRLRKQQEIASTTTDSTRMATSPSATSPYPCFPLHLEVNEARKEPPRPAPPRPATPTPRAAGCCTTEG